MITSLKADIKNILNISTTEDGTKLSDMVSDFHVVEEFKLDKKDLELKSTIVARNVEDGEEYIVELDWYSGFWVLRLENGDEFLLIRA